MPADLRPVPDAAPDTEPVDGRDGAAIGFGGVGPDDEVGVIGLVLGRDKPNPPDRSRPLPDKHRAFDIDPPLFDTTAFNSSIGCKNRTRQALA